MIFVRLIIAIFALLTTACTIHTVDIQQGNVITTEMVKQLKIGMSKSQVRFVMGTPPVEDPFHANRWDYIYTMQPGDQRRIVERKHVVVYFEDDKLTKLDQNLGDI